MDYVHCYTCYVQLKEETEHLFYISSCGKLYCSSKCLQKAQGKKCCQSSPKCEVILLTQAPPEVQEFFADVGTVLEEMQMKCKKIIDYQNGLRERMFKCIFKKYANLKAEYVKLSEHYNTLHKDYKRLQDHVKRESAARQSHSIQTPNSAASANQILFGSRPQPSQSIFRNQPQGQPSSVLFSVGNGATRNFNEIRHNNSLNASNLSSSAVTPSNMSINSYGGSTIRGNNSYVGSALGSAESNHLITLSKLSLNKYKRT
ncbi:uncharacterized protein LOC123293060 [Chrysoperla carnea]|uniref:uncharacterized protein LOC123293060 n=1 Tax=Chrysoperla carnea TaxID=189513 RepID=UPI001D074889|nr:uncharacterized protein LOC123293060 [Chrysoperla carnea]